MLLQHYGEFWATFKNLEGWPEEPNDEFLNCLYGAVAVFLIANLGQARLKKDLDAEIARFGSVLERELNERNS